MSNFFSFIISTISGTDIANLCCLYTYPFLFQSLDAFALFSRTK
jgi:hypothetical protein